MNGQLLFLPHNPARQGPPTAAELNAAINVSHAVSDAGVQFGESMSELGKAAYKATEGIRTLTLSFTMTRRERRRLLRFAARVNRRPALIHNGRKPR